MNDRIYCIRTTNVVYCVNKSSYLDPQMLVKPICWSDCGQLVLYFSKNFAYSGTPKLQNLLPRSQLLSRFVQKCLNVSFNRSIFQFMVSDSVYFFLFNKEEGERG